MTGWTDAAIWSTWAAGLELVLAGWLRSSALELVENGSRRAGDYRRSSRFSARHARAGVEERRESGGVEHRPPPQEEDPASRFRGPTPAPQRGDGRLRQRRSRRLLLEALSPGIRGMLTDDPSRSGLYPKSLVIPTIIRSRAGLAPADPRPSRRGAGATSTRPLSAAGGGASGPCCAAPSGDPDAARPARSRRSPMDASTARAMTGSC